MPPKWTELVLDGLQSVVSSFNPANFRSEPERKSVPAAQPASVRDNDNHIQSHAQRNRHRRPPVAASHASVSRSISSRVQMPPSRSSTIQRKPSAVREFLNEHDNAECDPIICDSDEDDDHSQPHSRKPSSQTPAYLQSHPRTVLTRAASRGESKLMRTLSYDKTASDHSRPTTKRVHSPREPDATTIPDPMMMMNKKSVFLKSGHRPVNTLDKPSNNSKAEFVRNNVVAPREGQQQDSPTRIKVNHEHRANDHDTPNKRLKTAHSSQAGTTSTAKMDKSQSILDDSPDELQLSPPSNSRPMKIAPSQKMHFQTVRNGSVLGNQQLHSVDLSRSVSRSPENEDSFTKNSARRRKAQKDDLLRSSSPIQAPSEVVSEQVLSPYFDLPNESQELQHKIQKQDQRTGGMEISADSLPAASVSAPETTLGKLRGAELVKKLIPDSSRNANVSNSTRGRPNKSIPSDAFFNLKEVVHSDLDSSNAYVVKVSSGSKHFSIDLQSPSSSNYRIPMPFSMNKIVQYRHDNECMVNITFSRNSTSDQVLFLVFVHSQSATRFRDIVQSNIPFTKMILKSNEWMTKAVEYAKGRKDGCVAHVKDKDTQQDNLVPDQPISTKYMTAERVPRLGDRLDAPTKTFRTPTIISGSERASAIEPAVTVEIPRVQKDPRSQRSVARIEAQSPEHDGLQQRTSYRQNGSDVTDSKGYDDPKPRLSATGPLGPRWSRDLVYPKPGKRSATVPFEDLDRLGEDEFLNDNLISFFMQYLETFMELHNPDLHKRTYFFNTYFFERLTQSARARSINFPAVSRWTKAIDIFSRDFVVVPVNENLHWYLAIICNLPYLRSPREEENEVQVDKTADTDIQPHDKPATDKPQVISDLITEQIDGNTAPTTETQNSFAGLSLHDNEMNENEMLQAHPKKSPNKRKQPRRSLPKYPLDKPVIITLDSLGMPRSGTCSILKSYIRAEAKDKRNLDIEDIAIRGMTAKGIPTQSNFSDCGLYLCMYLEQFIAGPDNFVSRILQREESAQLWPSNIRSEDLRTRLRDLILELHRRQEEEKSSYDIPEVGSIMLGGPNQSTYLKADDRRRSTQTVQQADQSFDELRKSSQNGSTSRAVELMPDRQHENGDREAPERLSRKNEMANKTDQDGSHALPSTRLLRRQKATNGRDEADNDFTQNGTPDSARKIEESITAKQSHNSPADLVADLKQRDEEREGLKRQRRSKDNGHKRSDSASTEYLSGLASYASLAASAAPSCRGGPNKSRKRENNVAVEIKASQDSQSFHSSDVLLSNDQPDRKRKRNTGRTAHEIEPIVGRLEVLEQQQQQQQPEPSRSEEHHRKMPTSDEPRPRGGRTTPSPRKTQLVIEVEDSEAGDEDLDGQMLLN